MNRRNFLIKGIGAAILAGTVPTFLPRLLEPEEKEAVLTGPFPERKDLTTIPNPDGRVGWFLEEVQSVSIVNSRSVIAMSYR